MRPILFFVAAATAVALTGCSSRGPTASSSRIDRCANRLLQRSVDPRSAGVKRYARKAYCAPFDDKGWVYDDGSLRIEAYLELERGGTCATAKPGEPAKTVPCEEIEDEGPLILDCALLHIVRKREVEKYVAGLPKEREVRCDDGTPLAELGAT